MAGLYGRSMFRFLRSLQIIFQSGCTSLHFHLQHQGLFFPTSFLTPIGDGVFDDDYSNWDEVEH
jgi:hypothetical protein